MIYKGKDISKYSPMIFNKILDHIENYYHLFQNIIRNILTSEIAKIKLVSELIENIFKKFIDEKHILFLLIKLIVKDTHYLE